MENGFKCECACGYTSTRCEIEINDCQPNPCVNGGTCVKPTKCGFQCICPQPYNGSTCSEVESNTPTSTTPNQFLINFPQEIVDYGNVDNVNFIPYLPCIYQALNVANPPSK